MRATGEDNQSDLIRCRSLRTGENTFTDGSRWVHALGGILGATYSITQNKETRLCYREP